MQKDKDSYVRLNCYLLISLLQQPESKFNRVYAGELMIWELRNL